MYLFQSTHPQRVRLCCDVIAAFFRGFNPRTHKGCDAQIEALIDKKVSVSIHAPTKGATSMRSVYLCSVLFQSTHPQRVRPQIRQAPPEAGVFQSTHPQRVRLNINALGYSFPGFNPRTHKGCDFWFIGMMSYLQRFNPRTHKGCDCTLNKPLYIKNLEQVFCEKQILHHFAISNNITL